jgi:CopA family copper-resistance protein
MYQNKPTAHMGADISRRRFVKGLSVAGALAFSGQSHRLLAAGSAAQGPAVLRGTTFNLEIGETPINFTGTPRMATTVNGSLPAPTLRWKEGETVTLNVTNTLNHTTSIHWHGLILPNEMDGVPGLTFDGIAPGATFTYRFKVQQSGTYWYHSHSGFQEQTGLYGSIIIDPARAAPFDYDREYLIQLSDWSDETPERIYAKLKKLSHYYNFNERTAGELFAQIKAQGVKSTWNNRAMWNQMRMSSRDLEDVSGYTYTYLMNGDTPREGWKGLFKKGEKILLRFVNASAMTFFDVRIPGLKMTVVASDGQYIQPVTVDEFRIGVAETYDVLIEPSSEQAYTVFAQSIGRSGYARGTLTPDMSLSGEIPELDAVPSLTHTDMGMNHSNMPGMDMSSMEGMDHSNMPGMDHSGMQVMADTPTPEKVTHAKTEFGPHVDMRADTPMVRLNDPGVGLRDNGRRVLTYGDIASLRLTRDRREPEREIELHLTGNMARYMWSINGVKFADSEPLKMKYGERLRITLVNDTMMNHPMHLHGLWSELETGDPRHLAKKHTVVVQPGSKISYLVTADALGNWAYHCHLLYHMPGMFRKVVVA